MPDALPGPVRAGTWVEVHRVVLGPGARAPQVPPDTQLVPLELLARGWLDAPAVLGDDVSVTTATGRHVHGTLVAVEPGYDHTFGPPVPELLAVGRELRALLEEAP